MHAAFNMQLIECPSVYEMLPNPEFQWKKQPEIQVWQKQTKDGDIFVNLESYGPMENVALFEEALRHNEVLPFDIISWRREISDVNSFGVKFTQVNIYFILHFVNPICAISFH